MIAEWKQEHLKEHPDVFCGYTDWSMRVMSDFYGYYVTSLGQLTKDFLDLIKPHKIFFLHWSWKVPKEITDNFFCIGFHAADLPNFRGGDPIGNQQKQGLKETKLTAFLLAERFDAGPVLLKRPLSLEGTKEDVLKRIEPICSNMIEHIMYGKFDLTDQDLSQGSFYTRADAK